MIIGVLASLSAAAAAGMRIALPLLIIGLLHSETLWSTMPVLRVFHPQVLLSILISWSLFELFVSKKLLGQRVLQLVELVFSPWVGGLLAVVVAQYLELDIQPLWILGITGGLLALVIKLVQVGWFFRLQGLPLGVICVEDSLCVFLVFFAFNAPEQGGLIAMLLLWIAVRSSNEWRSWYLEGQKQRPPSR